MIEFLMNFGVGILGAFAFLLWHGREHLKNKTWNLKTHAKENLNRWVWIWFMLLIICIIYWIVPEGIGYFIKTLNFEIPMEVSKVLFLGIGVKVSQEAKNTVQKVNTVK